LIGFLDDGQLPQGLLLCRLGPTEKVKDILFFYPRFLAGSGSVLEHGFGYRTRYEKLSYNFERENEGKHHHERSFSQEKNTSLLSFKSLKL
jgi:hypothetical protein